jgi:K+-sensing histidine kinase KdpD
MPTILTHAWYLRHPLFGRAMSTTMSTTWYVLPRAAALAIASLILASCAELGEFPNDSARLRSDLQANTQTLSQISARLDELERRQADLESTARQTQQELSQAVEVLLRKALIAENRQTTREAGKSQPKDAEKPESQARQVAPAGQGASLPWGDPHQGRKQLSLGMTQDDVRRILGEPISIEQVGSYVFWQYSPMSNQQYVIFETVNGRVSGWRGL